MPIPANIILEAHTIKGKVGEALRQSIEQLALSQRLVTIDCAVPLDQDWRRLSLQSPKRAELAHAFETLGFRRWQKEFSAPEPVAQTYAYACITTLPAWRSWCARVRENACVALDFETTGLDVLSDSIVGVAMAVSATEACYVPLAHQAGEQLPMQTVIDDLATILADPKMTIIGHHLKYDFGIWARYGAAPKARWHDTMLMSYVLYGSAHRHDMSTLAKQYLARETTSFEAVVGDPKRVTFDQVPLDKATEYAAEDASVTWALHQYFTDELAKHPALNTLLETVEYPLLALLGEMERRGVLIDAAALSTYSETLKQAIDALEAKAMTWVDEPFNLSSPKQLRHVLFESLQLPVMKNTQR